uniref:type II CRISPR-associated endonuclease Cas1 n=1 Tax=uncultured Allobacillus sp. TaxID=1638025 RepID=UPI002596A87C|nr:type II CRISPR-associated endonuclease Cas1 [uncultured Allobacillus sp.]
MSWRIIHVNQVNQLSLQLDNLKVLQGDREVKIPLRDIFALVIEDLTCKLTGRLLVELSKNNVLVLLCNQKYLPECLIQPVTGHYGQYKQMVRQIEWYEGDKGNLWREIVKQKIHNQAIVMKRKLVENHRVEKMIELKNSVLQDDVNNMEGQAAKIYFNSFFGDGYNRRNDNYIENAAFNYGYAILNSAIARTIVAKGLIPSLGIHHSGERNSYNLASDLIEPFRPIVDYYVLKNPPDQFLTKEYRIQLINLLHSRVEIGKNSQTVIRSIEICIDSILDFFDTGKFEKLKFPDLNKITYHEL